MVGIFAVTHQIKVQAGTRVTEASWPSFASRASASSDFLRGFDPSWFRATTHQQKMLSMLPKPGTPVLFQFIDRPIDLEQFGKTVRLHDLPTVIGPGAGLLDGWRDTRASRWGARVFTQMNDVELAVSLRLGAILPSPRFCFFFQGE